KAGAGASGSSSSTGAGANVSIIAGSLGVASKVSTGTPGMEDGSTPACSRSVRSIGRVTRPRSRATEATGCCEMAASRTRSPSWSAEIMPAPKRRASTGGVAIVAAAPFAAGVRVWLGSLGSNMGGSFSSKLVCMSRGSTSTSSGDIGSAGGTFMAAASGRRAAPSSVGQTAPFLERFLSSAGDAVRARAGLLKLCDYGGEAHLLGLQRRNGRLETGHAGADDRGLAAERLVLAAEPGFAQLQLAQARPQPGVLGDRLGELELEGLNL